MTIDVMRDVEAIARMDVVPTILDMVCRSTGMGFAAVARVTEEQWIACAVRDSIAFGLAPGGELPLETTLCNEIRQSGCLVVIDHVAEDDRYRTHRTPALYGFQSYISVPIRRTNGHFFGTLCAIDPKPARLQHGDTIAMFTLFADLIGRHLDAQEPFTRNQNALADEREASKLRDQFLAVLGHDLREPLAAIQAGASLLKKTASDDRSAHVAEVIERSVGRMGSLIQNVMDFARGRFGGGLPIAPQVEPDLEKSLQEIIAAMRLSHADRIIDAEFTLTEPVSCDRSRLGQLLTNLLGNALTHGDVRSPVWVVGRSDPTGFELYVENVGEPIPPHLVDRLFQPFVRSSERTNHKGLGLGLYIAAEIARAHGGTLSVSTAARLTRFTLRMPLSLNAQADQVGLSTTT
jgi:signal transduction histidine kinase